MTGTLILIREGIDDMTPVGLAAVTLELGGLLGTKTAFHFSVGASAPGTGQRTTGQIPGSPS